MRVSVPQFSYWPLHAMSGIGSINFYQSTRTLDGIGEYDGLVLPAPATGSIAAIWYRIATVSTPITSGSEPKIGVYALDGSGLLDFATPWGTGTEASVTEVAANSTYRRVLSSPASVTLGDRIAVGLCLGSLTDYPSFSQGYLQGHTPFGMYVASAYPYSSHNVGTASRASWANGPSYVLEYSDGRVFGVPGALSGMSSGYSATFNNTQWRGGVFTLPFPVRATGLLTRINATVAYTTRLLDNRTGRVLAEVQPAAYGSFRGSTSGGPTFTYFSSPMWLEGNVEYAVMATSDSSTNVQEYELTVYDPNSNAEQAIAAGWGNYPYLQHGTAWPFTQVPTTRVFGYAVLFDEAEFMTTAPRTRSVKGR